MRPKNWLCRPRGAACLLPFVLLVVATTTKQDGEHDPGQDQQGAWQAPTIEPLAKEPEPEQGGEEGVAGEEQTATPGAESVHAGKEGGVADEDADEAGEGQQGRALSVRVCQPPVTRLALASIRLTRNIRQRL